MASSPTQTLVYKTVNGLSVPLDIYLPPQPHNAPVYLWFHGGGLLQGSRTRLAPHHRRSVSKYHLALISADYRLAPQVGVAEILDDVLDCIAYIREKLVEKFPADTLDITRLAVSGSSAGGYLALLAGLYAEPKPQVVLPVYPITDPLGNFFTTSHHPLPFGHEKVERDAVAEFLETNADVVANNADDSARSKMYFYMLQEANLASLLRLDDSRRGRDDSDKFRIAKRIRKCGLPPTFIVHGDVDEAVGVEQSDEVVGVMVGLGLHVEYQRFPDKNHLFDTRDDVELDAMYAFMMRHL